MAASVATVLPPPLGVLALWVGAYFLGGVPTGWIVGRLAGVDLRQVGTGKIGTSNLFHTVGLLPAAVVGPIQFLQGMAPVLVAVLLKAPAWVAAGAGLCAVIGNGWPIYLQYHGGRGVASSTGAVALWSWPGIGYVLVMVIVGGALRRSALGVLLAFIGLPVVLWLTGAPSAYAVTAVGVAICLLLRRFEGYHLGPREPGEESDGWASRLLYDRRPEPALPAPTVDSAR
ncbi:MAG: glycerol-3-phosphate acyltransferase [Candidatus Dormibacteria bacterium]